MKKYRKVLPNDAETMEFLESLPKIFVVGRWARFGVRECPVTELNRDGVPMVYDYYDGNGTCDEWHLVPLTWTTTGDIWCWTTSWLKAEEIARVMREADEVSGE